MSLSFRSLTDSNLYRLEKLVREAVANKDQEKIRKIVDQLCHEYAYAVHQPHARNGGLIGLAAASIALGSVFAKLLWCWLLNTDQCRMRLHDI